ncbi:hypothetical protein LPJ81_000509 [Coemansia sp. IMI 209127]|nr:hypothetical protein LPJ81_000509 [Coemansia sp. IMI 209127]
MFSSARSFSKQVLNHRTQIQQQTKSQLRNQHNGPRAKDQQQQQQQQQQNNNTGRHDEDSGNSIIPGRQVVLDKMRFENRERKKRWREVNEERNKDNDLRCRVNKRANQLYGAQSSADKEKWIGEEFVRRQQRRRDKEVRRRGGGTSSVPLRREASSQQQQQQQQTPERIPQGFGSYAALQPHQVSAAYGFWKSVAGQHALEETDPAAAGSGVGLRLPPLSSIVPLEHLPHRQQQQQQQQPSSPVHVGALPTAASHAGMTAATSGHKRAHVRPWEMESGEGLLAEAAFSLMSLSSPSAYQ